MVSLPIFIISLFAVAILAWIIATLVSKQKQAKLSSELNAAKNQADELKNQIQQLNNDLKTANQENVSLKQQNASLETRLQEQGKNLKEQIDNLNAAKEQMKLEFENLAHKILEEKETKFDEHTKEQMNNLLSPLQTQLEDFKKKVEEVYINEGKERFSLQNEIKNLHAAYETLSEEANNLVHALKADTKMQGDWGEINLRRILDYIGLQEGINYFVQPNYKNEEGENLRPDIVVNLPNGKQIIVDSKVSLTAYERYVNAETDNEKQNNLDEHIKSIRKHVIELSEKKYEDLPGINTLDFVLMFIPIEAAYFAAVEADNELYKFASEKKVLPVCPSTLLITMQLVVNLWQWDKQNRYAQEISAQGAKLLEKFSSFISSLDDVKYHLGKSTDALEQAQKKLYQGKGSLITHADKLTRLGVKLSTQARKKLDEYLDLQEQEPLPASDSEEEIIDDNPEQPEPN
ncbi:MAG: DNA recombination protein RmuC [Candidatus Cloacimonadaceae bacterium]